MTVFFQLNRPAAAIASHFGAAQGEDPWSGGPIAPGQFAPVVTAGREAIAGPRQPGAPRRMVPRLWGVPPPSATGPGRSVLTVRNPDSPFWIGNLRNSEFRCLVPATGFMVWGKGVDREGKRVRHWLGCTDQPLFAFAGVWKDSEVPSFALLTTEPNALLRELGAERMPAILPADPAAWKLWLNGSWDGAAGLVRPFPSGMMRTDRLAG